MRIPRKQILEHLYDCIERKEPIIGSGAGIGLTAKCEEAGGSDLIIVYNTGYYRMQGRPSIAGMLPLGNANDIMLAMSEQILPVVKKTPVIAGVYANDPFKNMDMLLDKVAEIGYSGIQNFPTIGDYEGNMRKMYFSAGFNYDNEVDLIGKAVKKDLLTTAFIWSEEDALKMIDVGCDVLVVHASGTIGGSVGMDASLARSLDETCDYVQAIQKVSVAAKKDIIILIHGGPVAYPADLEYVLQHTEGVHGFYGASSCERLPVEEAVTKRMQEFKGVKYAQ